MKPLGIAVLLAVLLAALSACGTLYTREYGTKALTKENVAKIVDGETSKVEVRAIFGDPVSVTTNSFGEMWTYTRSVHGRNVAGLTSELSSMALVVNFNREGIVQTHSMSTTNPVGGGVTEE